jgi:hypothetical protein
VYFKSVKSLSKKVGLRESQSIIQDVSFEILRDVPVNIQDNHLTSGRKVKCDNDFSVYERQSALFAEYRPWNMQQPQKYKQTRGFALLNGAK